MNPTTLTMIALIRQTASGAQSAPDRSGVEAALRLKKQIGGTVTAVCLGDDGALPLLREAVAMGCDDALLIRAGDSIPPIQTDAPSSRIDAPSSQTGAPSLLPEGFRCSDPAFCASVLAAALRPLRFDIVFAGCYAVDADAIQIGFLLAERLHLPEAGYAEEITLTEETTVQVKRQFEDRVQLLELPLPCLISALPQPGKRIYPTAEGVTRAYSMNIPVLSVGELGLSEEPIASVRLFRSHAKKERKRGTVLTVPTEEAVTAILDTMIKNHIL